MSHAWELDNPWAGIPLVGNLIAAIQADLEAIYSLDFSGNGSPEGIITAPVGSTYQRKDGGVGSTFYVKESGSGNTGWVAK